MRSVFREGEARLLGPFYAKNQTIMYLGMVSGPLAAGAIVAAWGIKPLWFVWGGGYLLAAAGLTLIAEHYAPSRTATPLRQTVQQTGETLRLLKEDRNLGLVFVASAFIAVVFLDGGFWQPLLADLELPVAGIGYVTAGAAVVGAVLSLLIPKLNRGDFRVLLVSGIATKMIILCALPLLYGPRYLFASGLFVVVGAAGAFEGPLLNPYVQQRLPSRLRATAVSIKSLVFKLIMGLGGITLGVVADRTGLRTVFPFVALFGIGAIWALIRIERPLPSPPATLSPDPRDSKPMTHDSQSTTTRRRSPANARTDNQQPRPTAVDAAVDHPRPRRHRRLLGIGSQPSHRRPDQPPAGHDIARHGRRTRPRHHRGRTPNRAGRTGDRR